ncbi:MAG: bifunctional metallophosphatase/5'-nucleotidase [Xanthobacteraceae bacterium]
MYRPIRFALLIFLGLAVQFAPAAAARITFVLVNDIYQISEQTMADGKARGGFARLAAVVKAERERGNPVIFAHGGDTLSPSLLSGLDHGESIITLTNLVRPDIFVPGNHEFDFGKAVFLQRMKQANFPLLAANLRDKDGQPIPGFKDSDIVTLDGVRIGLVGAAYEDSARASNPEDLTFARTVPTIRDHAAALRQDGADFVVAVMHATRGDALQLASYGAADLILTGHTHDLFIEFDGRNAIVESSYDAHYVVAIDVDIDIKTVEGRRQVTWWPNFRVIDTATVEPDLEVAAAVLRFENVLSREMDVPLGTTAVELDSRNATARAHEAAIGDLIADAMRADTGADVAVMNGGVIRSGKVYQPGSALTRRDILAELPFGNRLIRLEVTGADLRAALENGFSNLPQTAGRFPQVSGLTIEVDPARPAGSRIVSINAGGAPLDDTKTYSVATNDFMARGGDGYVQFRDARRVLSDDDAPILANAVMTYIQRLGTVRAPADMRIVVK